MGDMVVGFRQGGRVIGFGVRAKPSPSPCLNLNQLVSTRAPRPPARPARPHHPPSSAASAPGGPTGPGAAPPSSPSHAPPAASRATMGCTAISLIRDRAPWQSWGGRGGGG